VTLIAEIACEKNAIGYLRIYNNFVIHYSWDQSCSKSKNSS